MGKLQVVVAALAMAGVAQAVPTIDAKSVTFVQKGAQRAKITYSLTGAPAIVTVDIRTNGVSIGAANFTSLEGDVNKLISIDGAHTLTWNVYEDWPDCTITDESLTAVVTAWSPSYPPDYMALDLSGAKGTLYYTSAEALPGGVSNDLYKTDKLLMRKIHACNRTFRMGGANNELRDGYSSTEKAHLVTLTQDYWIGVYPFTQRQQFLTLGNVDNCTFTDKPDSNLRPANGGSNKIFRNTDNVNASPASGSVLAAVRSVTGLSIDLPTEAQWEFACRAGTETSLYSGQDIEDITKSVWLDKLAWYADNADGETHPVGLKEPNAFGLYDMLGNVGELVIDKYNDPNNDPVTDPLPTGGNGHIYKGGAFCDPASSCRPARRWTGAAISWSAKGADHGFRCALTIK